MILGVERALQDVNVDEGCAVMLLSASPKATYGAFHNKTIDLVNTNNTMAGAKVFIELWHLDDMQFNPLTHRDAASYRFVPPRQHRQLQRTLHLKSLSCLKELLGSDPAVQWIGGRQGDIVEATEDDPLRGQQVIHFRIV